MGAPILVPSSNPCPHAAIETRPNLWAEAESLLEPWANVTLTCQARLATSEFQLFKNGVCQEYVRLDLVTMEHRFPLGAATGDTWGLYRCRSGMGEGWTQLSNLLEVNGAGEQGLLWVSLLPLHLLSSSSCIPRPCPKVTLGTSPDISEPQFPHQENEVISALTAEGCKE